MKITITCETCHKSHIVDRTNEIPDSAISMGCNWCPECQDKAEDYYHEWHNYNEGGEGLDDVPDNQLCMPFILDEIISESNGKELVLNNDTSVGN